MAISDPLFALAISLAFNNLLLRTYNKFFAGIINIGIGIATLYFGYTAGGTYDMQIGIMGMTIIMGGLAQLIYDILSIYRTD